MKNFIINFDWDSAKAKAKAEINIKKHGISFEKATSVFYDEYAMQFFDENILILKIDF